MLRFSSNSHERGTSIDTERQRQLLADLASGSVEDRKAGVIWLAEAGGQEILPVLRKMSTDADVGVRSFAHNAIGKVRQRVGCTQPGPAQDLAELLRSDDSATRIRGAVGCYRFPTRELREQILEFVPLETDVHVRASLLQALSGWEDPRARVVLIEGLRHPDGRVRANAVEVLGLLDDPSLMSSIEPLLEDPDNRSRANAALLVARFDEEKARPVLRKMLESKQVWMTGSAIHALRQIGAGWCVEWLHEFLDSSPSTRMHSKARAALQSLEQPSVEASGRDGDSEEWRQRTWAMGEVLERDSVAGTGTPSRGLRTSTASAVVSPRVGASRLERLLPYSWLALAAGLSVSIVVLLGRQTTTTQAISNRRPAHARRSLLEQPAGERLAKIVSQTRDVVRLEGLGARWEGEVAQGQRADGKLLLKSAGTELLVDSSAFAETPVPGDSVSFFGTLEGRRDERILVSGPARSRNSK